MNGIEGFPSVPVGLFNVDGYYDNLIAQVERANTDQLLYKTPAELFAVFSCDSSKPETVKRAAKEAAAWCTEAKGEAAKTSAPRPEGSSGESAVPAAQRRLPWMAIGAAFVVGALCGRLTARV